MSTRRAILKSFVAALCAPFVAKRIDGGAACRRAWMLQVARNDSRVIRYKLQLVGKMPTRSEIMAAVLQEWADKMRESRERMLARK